MAVPHYTEVYGFNDARLRPLVTDNPSVTGPTYGAPVDVPGAGELTISGEVDSQELFGDDKLLAVRSTMQGFTVEVTFERVSLDVLEVLLGGNVTETSTQVRYDYVQTAPPLWRIDAKVEETISGLDAVRIVLWKVRLTDADVFDAKQNDFGEFKFSGRAMPLEASDPSWNNLSLTLILSSDPIDLSTGP